MLVEQNGEGAVIQQTDLHICSEDAGLYKRDRLPAFLHNILIDFLRVLRTSGLYKARTVPLRQFAYSVNWEIKSNPPSTSASERFVFP